MDCWSGLLELADRAEREPQPVSGVFPRRGDPQVGFAVTDKVRYAISRVPKKAWTPAIDPEGEARVNGDVVEITGKLNLTTWRTGCGSSSAVSTPTPAERCHCSTTLTGGATKPSRPTPPPAPVGRSPSSKPATAPTPHTSKVETRIRHAKDTGIGRFPSRQYPINQAWLLATSTAADLIAWLRLLALPKEAQHVRAESPALPHPARPRPPDPGARQRRLRFPTT